MRISKLEPVEHEYSLVEVARDGVKRTFQYFETHSAPIGEPIEYLGLKVWHYQGEVYQSKEEVLEKIVGGGGGARRLTAGEYVADITSVVQQKGKLILHLKGGGQVVVTPPQ